MYIRRNSLLFLQWYFLLFRKRPSLLVHYSFTTRSPLLHYSFATQSCLHQISIIFFNYYWCVNFHGGWGYKVLVHNKLCGFLDFLIWFEFAISVCFQQLRSNWVFGDNKNIWTIFENICWNKKVFVHFCNVFLFVFVYKPYVEFLCMSLHLCLSRQVGNLSGKSEGLTHLYYFSIYFCTKVNMYIIAKNNIPICT